MILALIGAARALPPPPPLATPNDVRVDNGDGTWSKPDDGLRRVGDLQVQGAVTWEYQGQYRYDNQPPVIPAEFVSKVAERSDGSGGILGTVRVTGAGEEWLAIDYDATELGFAEDVFRAGEIPAEIEDGERWEPKAWTGISCPGETIRRYNGESRYRRSSLSFAHDLHRSTVIIKTDLGECSGVLVGPRDVLTAAHCVADPGLPGNPTLSIARSVCSRGNSYPGADCVTFPPGGFTITPYYKWMLGFTNPSNDFALIEWAPGNSGDASTLTGGTSGVPVANRTKSSIEGLRAGVYGHPGRTGLCQSQVDRTKVDTLPFSTSGAWLMNDVWRTDHQFGTSRLKTRFDTSNGQSGAPVYQCPGSPVTCSGNSEEIIGLSTTYYSTGFNTHRTQGPNSARMYGFVNSNLPGN